ncbi:hypothetical protein [Pseudomonas sp. FW300-N2A2]|uniref:hypothetical protein n=1 Tax=Pseudomonas sp. FW300-N2A2 TaxID=2751316 RepID=UPI001A93864A|nr:hypothetical protein [Pseudomonas sp. FW300-N2A2]
MDRQIEGAQLAFDAAMAAGQRPAFPVPGDQQDESFNGVTIRDYFAIKVLQSLITEPQWDESASLVSRLNRGVSGPDGYAHAAYTMADAMLAARTGCWSGS